MRPLTRQAFSSSSQGCSQWAHSLGWLPWQPHCCSAAHLTCHVKEDECVRRKGGSSEEKRGRQITFRTKRSNQRERVNFKEKKKCSLFKKMFKCTTSNDVFSFFFFNQGFCRTSFQSKMDDFIHNLCVTLTHF